MQKTMLLVVLICMTGCGTKTADQKNAAGIPLSINNSAAEVPKPDPAQSIADPAVEQLIQKARAAVVAGRPAFAIEALSQAIGNAPKESRLFRLRADVYALMGEYANAQADFSIALNLDPENAELYNVRGYFLMTRGLADKSIADFDKAIELDPELSAAWNNRGLVSLSKKDYKAAEADFGKAIEVRPDYTDALNNRGFARMKMGQFDAALVDLKATIKTNPEYETAWNNCGLVYMQQENYLAAVEAFSEAVRLAPMEVRWVNHRRAAYLKLDRFEDANADARKIRWLSGLSELTKKAISNSGSAALWTQRGQYLNEGSEFGAAIQDFTRALTITPGNTDALNGRALAWLKTGDTRKAIADCDESLVIESSTAAYSVRGDAWLSLKNFDQAVQDFEAAQRFDETVATAYANRALERKQNGKVELAKADEQKAAQITAALAGELGNGGDAPIPLPFPEN